MQKLARIFVLLSAIVFPAAALSADYSYFCNGQSNPLGKQQGGWQNWPENVLTRNNLNNVGNVPTDPGDDWIPLDVEENPFSNEANTYCATSVSAIAEQSPTDDWQYVNSSRGSVPFYKFMEWDDLNSEWVNGPDYNREITVIEAAKLDGLELPFDVMMHGQGENSDPLTTTGPRDLPQDKFTAFPVWIDDLEARGYIDSNTIILMMETSENYVHINPVTRVLAAQYPNAYLVPIRDFQVATGSLAHFDASELRDIGLMARDVYNAAIAGPATPDPDPVFVSAQSEAGQLIFSGTGADIADGFMPGNWDIEDVDTHDAFDGTVFYAQRDGPHTFEVMLTAQDKDYPEGTTFSVALFRLGPGGEWYRAASLGYDTIEGQVRRPMGLNRTFTVVLDEGEPVWIGTRMNPPTGESFPTGIVPKLYNSGFLNQLVIRELN